jgi:hypothetical protein
MFIADSKLRSLFRLRFFRRDFHGNPAWLPECDHSGKQHRADGASAAGTLSSIIFVLPG